MQLPRRIGYSVMPESGQRTPPSTPDDVLTAIWNVMLAWSPRAAVRTDRHREHVYATTALRRNRRNIQDHKHPEFPVAIHLHDQLGQLRLLACDFDDRGSGVDPDADAADFADLLDRLQCPSITVESSRDGRGRHVWVFLSEALSHRRQLLLTDALVRRYRSLDRSPLCNTSTGCVRYPGSSHRRGGHSRVTSIGVPVDANHAAIFTGLRRAPADIDARIIDALDSLGPHPATDLAPRDTMRRVDEPSMIHNAIRAAATRLRAHHNTPLPPEADPHLPAAPVPTAHRLPQILPLKPRTLTAEQPSGTLDLYQLAALRRHERRRRRGATNLGTPPLQRTPLTQVDADATEYTNRWTAQWSIHDIDRADALGLGDHIAALNQRARTLLNPNNPPLEHTADHSRVMFSALLSAAAAGWSSTDIELFSTHFTPPAFSHAYTERTSHGRRARHPSTAAAVLARQFGKARAVIARTGVHTRDGNQPPRTQLASLAVDVLAAADSHGIDYTCRMHTTRRVLEAMLARALLADTDTFYAGVRDIALDAGIASPQTVATKISDLVALGYLTIVTPSQGRRAHQYRITAPRQHTAEHWTQGSTAPGGTPWGRLIQDLPTTEIGELLQLRTGHFRHDVWTAQHVGDLVALTAFHYVHTSGQDPNQVSAHSGRSPQNVHHDLDILTELGLLDADGTPHFTHDRYVAAADATGTAGYWHRRRIWFRAEHQAWDWWCAEVEFLSATKASTPTVAARTILKERGRYPRIAATGDQPARPDHAHARALIAAELAPNQWRSR
ncbi:TOTE conflict system archaeo-eukaryotic primase domain-containing protein [Gordonia alkanivorans]|uniref:TOTE conflict system archaeo-eukaryotic primase domain-containing protein n=1 Tax=Gordonia alkanivorans TaxID=84096 RepID=UPI0004BC19AF|nr:hypothetical protein [Gordonia alkanivorans]